MVKVTNAIKDILGTSNAQVKKELETCYLCLDSFHIGWIVLNNKSKSVNVLDEAFMKDLEQLLTLIKEEQTKTKTYHVIIFISEKSSFVVGADVFSLYPVREFSKAKLAATTGQAILTQIEKLNIPTIAAINGDALGGGFELALACRYRFAAQTKKLQVGLPEVQLGLIPGCGGTVRLPKLIGLQPAMKLILAGSNVRAEKALKLGMVDKLVECDEALGNNRFFHGVRREAMKFVDAPKGYVYKRREAPASSMLDNTWIGRKIIASQARKNLDKMTKGNYPAVYAALESVLNGYAASIEAGLAYEAELFAKMASNQTSKNLIGVFFLRERAKKLRRVRGTAAIQQTAVIGSGVMGAGIGQLFVSRNYQTYMKDIKQEFVDNGMAFIYNKTMSSLKRRGMSEAAAKAKIDSLVTGGVHYDSFDNTNLVVEAAVENMNLKKKILQECEGHMNTDCLFATNTSTLSITELATVSSRPQNVIGMHFFNPVAKMPLVEIIRGQHTSDEAVNKIYAMTLKLGKIPVICNDGPGFIVNRILGAFLNESIRLLAEGGDIVHTDDILIQFGLPMGAFRLFDEVGLDVAAHSGDTLSSLGDRFARDEALASKLVAMMENKQLGRKVGKGFYTYKAPSFAKKEGVNPKLARMIKYAPTKKHSKRSIIDRCILLMVNEAAYILGDGIAFSPSDVDTAMIFGTGFAPFRGGLLAYADQRGIPEVVSRLQRLEKKHGSRFAVAPTLLKMAEKNKKFFPQKVYLREKKQGRAKL
mmetsp:Transcript_4876/g.7217  ORF Transcript_4876/g.7217 Transcript_4876/m.7217 type:complete len:759 (+) Transcript_4876:34-2310(+)